MTRKYGIPVVEIGDSAKHILTPASAPAGGWTLPLASCAIEHLGERHTKAELVGAIAYLACQYHGARESKTDDDAKLALHQIKTAIGRYEERRGDV